MIPVGAFIFDLDGTLIDPRVDLAGAVNAALAAAGRPRQPVERIATYVGDGVHMLLARAFELEDAASPAAHAAPLVDPHAAPLAGALAVFRAHYREHCLDHTRLYPGVLETLDHFRDKAHAVVSNKPEDFSRLIIDRLGLGRHIRIVVGGGSAPALKPDPAPVRLALERLGVDATGAVMVGDGLTDLEAGRRAGLRTCAVAYGIGDPRVLAGAHPDHLIGAFAELCDLFI